MEHETAGDPMSGLKWTRKTTKKISEALKRAGIHVSRNTVARLLTQMDFRLRVNHKKRSRVCAPDRDKQFRYIKRTRRAFAQLGVPVMSIDSKKRELVGNFKNAGVAWKQKAVETLDHDFPSDAEGVAIPYGLYDTEANRGFVVVGTSRETPAFAVDCLVKWWQLEGRKRYPNTERILILADCGGGNGSRSRVWKARLQSEFCDRYGLKVTVCHYPPGASKWNPVEHRLFSRISSNWEGEPLESYEKILKFIRTTTTDTGLKVRASLNKKNYPTGGRIADQEMKTLRIKTHTTRPKWNYTISPRNLMN
jgi:hypothetical protein